MIRSLFLITEYGGDYEDSWETTRAFGFLTHEEAERQLTEAGWKKEVSSGWITYDNPFRETQSFDIYMTYYAKIHEYKFYDKDYRKEI